MGFCSASLGLGIMLGPVIGQLIYSRLGFQNTFFFFTGLITFSYILAMVVIPSTFN
jgi:predicted MFS family arabinose efflux permease